MTKMTLEQVRDSLRSQPSIVAQECADAIDAHLTQQPDLAAIREGLELIAGTNGSECASPRAKAAELLKLLHAIGDKP